jgi:hypothetical protein
MFDLVSRRTFDKKKLKNNVFCFLDALHTFSLSCKLTIILNFYSQVLVVNKHVNVDEVTELCVQKKQKRHKKHQTCHNFNLTLLQKTEVLFAVQVISY